MSQKSSVEVFRQSLDKRLDNIKDSLEKLKVAIISVKNSTDIKIVACQDTVQKVELLKESIAPDLCPAWIPELINVIDNFVKSCYAHEQSKFEIGNYSVLPCNEGKQSTDPSLLLFNTIIECAPHIENQTWDFIESPKTQPIDFDAYFQKYYDESRLPELFDILIGHIQVIIESEQINDIRIITQLQKLINTIKRNARGSYFSTYATFEFATSLLKNIALEYAGSVPVLGEIMRAVKKTMDEFKEEFETVQQKTAADIKNNIDADLPVLRYTPSGTLLLEEKRTLNLEA